MPIWLETTEPNLAIDPQQNSRLLATGDWTFQHANALISLLREKRSGMHSMDARSISRLDATGSQLLMAFLRRQGIEARTNEMTCDRCKKGASMAWDELS